MILQELMNGNDEHFFQTPRGQSGHIISKWKAKWFGGLQDPHISFLGEIPIARKESIDESLGEHFRLWGVLAISILNTWQSRLICWWNVWKNMLVKMQWMLGLRRFFLAEDFFKRIFVPPSIRRFFLCGPPVRLTLPQAMETRSCPGVTRQVSGFGGSMWHQACELLTQLENAAVEGNLGLYTT